MLAREGYLNRPFQIIASAAGRSNEVIDLAPLQWALIKVCVAKLIYNILYLIRGDSCDDYDTGLQLCVFTIYP